MAKKIIQFSASDKLRGEIEEKAEEMELSLSATIRYLIKRGLRDEN